MCILPEESAFRLCDWSEPFDKHTHTHAKPGTQNSVWIGPSEARYHTVYQSVTKLPHGCIFLSPFLQVTTFPLACGFTVWGSSQVRLTTLFIRSPRCLLSGGRPWFASLQVAINQSRRGQRDRQSDGQTGSERRQLAASRQPTGERADDAPSPPCNAKGFIRVSSSTFPAKFILTFTPGWSPARRRSPLRTLWQVSRMKSSSEWQYGSTTELRLKDYL